jgi:cytidylate kinase
MSREIEQLVERRIRQWEAQQRVADRQAKRPEEPGAAKQYPAIAISRSHGAGGRQVADRVAERLSLEIYEKQLIERIAESASVREQIVESVSSDTRGHIRRWLARMFDEGQFSDSDYLHHLTAVLLTIVRQEPALLVDFGAQFVLERSRTLTVRIVAPREVRIKRIAELRGLDEQRAQKEVDRIDEERYHYCWRHFYCEIDDCEGYDLVINTGHLALDNIVELICQAYRERFASPTQPRYLSRASA